MSSVGRDSSNSQLPKQQQKQQEQQQQQEAGGRADIKESQEEKARGRSRLFLTEHWQQEQQE